MASGNSNAQEKNFRPGNSHTAVNQARLTPITVVPDATPRTSQNVFTRRPGNVVSSRCCQMSPEGAKREEITVPTGIRTSAATRNGMRRQPGNRRCLKGKYSKKVFRDAVPSAVALNVSPFTLRALSIPGAIHQLHRFCLQFTGFLHIYGVLLEAAPRRHRWIDGHAG